MYETDQLKGTIKAYGVGYAIVPLFYDKLPNHVDLYLGSPRDVLKNINDLGFEPPRSLSSLSFSVKVLGEDPQKLAWLMSLIPDNTLIGSNDELPGLNGTIMPSKIELMLQPSVFKPVDMQTVYAHNVRISSMNEVEQAFELYLKDWKQFPSEPGVETAVDSKPVILERRLSVSPHNSWRIIGGGSPSFVSLNKEVGQSGIFHSSGALKVLNFPVHPLIALIFKLEYRGKFFNLYNLHLL